jgi:hypothetical protein
LKENYSMKKITTILLLTAATLAAQAPGSTGATSLRTTKKTVAAAKATTAPQPLTIPKDAVANADGSFTWTDKAGKKWNYVQTPFGVVRGEASNAAAPAGSSLAGVKAFDEGDKVRFEGQSPFGPIKWEKSKTDLTDDERKLINTQTTSQNAKQD